MRSAGQDSFLAAANGRKHAFNKSYRAVSSHHGTGETNKTPDSYSSSKGGGNKGAEFVKFAVSACGVMGGGFNSLFGDCCIFHDNIPFDVKWINDKLLYASAV